ncbi:MAG: hypothetical protein ONB12_03785 [candidate division KSB1 bacterium]|nr:hypothetical protein [candidate division KSB1 bacterium]
MTKRTLFLLLLVGLASPLFAGKYALDFMRIGVGARPAAMGGAHVALTRDAGSFYWNPAGLAGVRRFALHGDYVSLFNGLSHYHTAGGALALRGDWVIGCGWVRLAVDDIPRYAPLSGSRIDRLINGVGRSNGQAIGSFSDAQDALIVSFAKKITFNLGVGPAAHMIVFPVELAFGVSGKYFRHQLDDKQGLGQGVDAGLIGKTFSRTKAAGEPVSWASAAVMLRDLSSTALIWNTASQHSDVTKPSLILGAAASHYLSGIRTRLTFTFDQEIEERLTGRAGFEAEIADAAAIRFGLSGRYPCAGAGLCFGAIRIDYAFVPHDLGNTHRVSLSLSR